MRLSQRCVLFGLISSFVLSVGCGSNSGPAKPVADLDEVAQYLADNPDQNVDGLEDSDQDVDLAD